MEITTKMKINADSEKVFNAFIDTNQLGEFWFSSTSEKIIEGKKVTLRYDEYDAEVNINVKEVTVPKRICYKWGDSNVFINFRDDNDATIVEVVEDGFSDTEVDKLLNQKEGWVYMLSCLKAYIEYGANIRAALR